MAPSLKTVWIEESREIAAVSVVIIHGREYLHVVITIHRNRQEDLEILMHRAQQACEMYGAILLYR